MEFTTVQGKICDQCGSEEFIHPNKIRHPLIIMTWGENILICNTCGAVRYPEELKDARKTSDRQI